MQTVGRRAQLHRCLYGPVDEQIDEQEMPGQSEQSGAHGSAKRHHVRRGKQFTGPTILYGCFSAIYTFANH